MGLVHGLAITVFTGVNAMPLLPELVPSEDGRCYKHGAPNGAVPKPALPIPPKTARNQNLPVAQRLTPDQIKEAEFRAKPAPGDIH